jgi:hypothetical protein
MERAEALAALVSTAILWRSASAERYPSGRPHGSHMGRKSFPSLLRAKQALTTVTGTGPTFAAFPTATSASRSRSA